METWNTLAHSIYMLLGDDAQPESVLVDHLAEHWNTLLTHLKSAIDLSRLG